MKGRWRLFLRVLAYNLFKDKRGSQLVEEGLLLGISLAAMAVVASMATGVLNSVKAAYEGARSNLDSFLTQVLQNDLNKIWEYVFGNG